MGKLVNIAGGVALGLGLSQFPEYSQQYVQRLGGAVDELTTVVEDFDTTAQNSGLEREEALANMTGTQFISDRQQDMRRTIARQETLSENYDRLRDAGAFSRLSQIHKFADPKIAGRAWEDYQPAVPLTAESGILLLGGYVLGYGGLAGLGRSLRRRRKTGENRA